MNEEKQKTIRSLLHYLHKIFRDQTVTEETINVYICLLINLDIEQLKAACKQHVHEGTRFPYPADLFALCEQKADKTQD